MCVSEFRDYCNASKYKTDDNGSFYKDSRDKNFEVSNFKSYRHDNGDVYQSVYYITDIRKMRQLANGSNRYAKQFIKDREE